MVGEFVAIRMIVLKPDEDPEDFEKWMTKETSPGVPPNPPAPSFLDEMGKLFKPHGLERITFLRGNNESLKDKRGNHLSKPPHPLFSDKPAAKRADSTAAGANAHFAWITYWTDKKTNQTAWQKAHRTTAWNQNWSDFKSKCLSKGDSRPQHGPPYDYLGVQGSLPGPGGRPIKHYGRGAGCLVEGFEVIYDKCNWS